MTVTDPSMNLRLTGTEEPVMPSRILRAGPLSAELESGNLRYVRYDGAEIMRAVSFIVRDRNWGTYNPEITNLEIEENGNGFRVRYAARTGDASQCFRYRATITGTPTSITFQASGGSEGPFLTNRTGFVVLHPVAGVAGEPVTIEHVDGRIVDGRFPALIDPNQPMMDLRALTNEPVPGLRVECRMEGDTFEMEDQRNWTDASYKTYVRPLALPWPYEIPPGERVEQTITLRVSGRPTAAVSEGGADVLTLGEATGALPKVGVGLHPNELAASRERQDDLAALGLDIIVCHFDPRNGEDLGTLARSAEFAREIGAEPWLEAVIAEVEGFEAEIATLASAASDAFPVVLVSPASDLKSTLPGSVWPPAPRAEQLYEETRRAFPKARIGGGMFSYFTELNRKRPPLASIDMVGFTTSAIVHAGDDRTVMEGLEALPFIAASASAITGDKPYFVGPSAIGMRMNPYGATPMENPANIRQAMNRNDPRQRGLLGAAWTLGYYARFATGGATAVVFGGTTGAQGFIHAPQSYPQPWYDEAGGLFPAFHVVRALARFSGRPARAVHPSQPNAVAAVAAEVRRDRRDLDRQPHASGSPDRAPDPTNGHVGSRCGSLHSRGEGSRLSRQHGSH